MDKPYLIVLCDVRGVVEKVEIPANDEPAAKKIAAGAFMAAILGCAAGIPSFVMVVFPNDEVNFLVPPGVTVNYQAIAQEFGLVPNHLVEATANPTAN